VKRLLWIGDAGCPSGFGLATHKILETVHKYFDVCVLGLNYRGDPHPYPYPIYAASPGGDSFGLGRLIWMCDIWKPDVIVIQNDPWNFPAYRQVLTTEDETYHGEYANVPVVGIVAVDGRNIDGSALNDLDLAIFWTEFGLEEARKGGFTKPGTVVSLGVDREVYFPESRKAAREAIGIPSAFHDSFIIGNVNRNQPRKRWDLTLQYFADWVKSRKLDDVYLYLHTAPTGDTGVRVQQYAAYLGIVDRIMLRTPPVWYGVPEEELRHTYNAFDLSMTTTQGEGFGLTTLEAMACGIPTVGPRWSGLESWAEPAMKLIPCSSLAIGPPYVNVVGGIADEGEYILALDEFYYDPSVRIKHSQAGLRLVQDERFDWANIGTGYTKLLNYVLNSKGV
jgi:D-inositol-3-phosphate glycosyltransferase